MRSAVTKAVKMCGLDIDQIYKAKNGREALDLMDQHPIDLLLIDINMPVLNGEQTVRELRRVVELADMPVIVISSEGSKKRVERLTELGAAFIKKPFNPAALRTAVESLIPEEDRLEMACADSDSEMDF